MSQNNPEENSVRKVLDLLSTYFNDTYDGLLNVLHEEPNYKRLLKIGEKQFFDAPNESSIEEESQKSRLCFAKTNLLAVQIDNDIDRIIEEKFQGAFLDKLKDQVLKAILQLTSDQVSTSETISQAFMSQVKLMKNEEKAVSAQIKNSSNSNSQSICDTKKEVRKKINGQAGPSLGTKFDKDNSDHDFSFGSVSSVHTSDLSSFEDEISLSSDEESGRKRRLSLKEVQEKLEKSTAEEMEITDDDKQVESKQDEDAQSDCPVNNKASSCTSHKSQRRRKPNLKYAADDMESPLKKKAVENIPSSSRSVCGDVPRKRGRPRKHST